MSSAYSPRGDTGGTMHLLSPTHIHQVDAASTFKIRRSLSRSPSKGPAFRLVTSKSTSPSPSSPLSPSCLSPPQRSASTPFILQTTGVAAQSPHAVPYRTSTARPRATARKLSPKRASSLTPNRQRSPGKRTLSDSSDQGNSAPRSSAGSNSDDLENHPDTNTSPAELFPNSARKANWPRDEENACSPFRALTRNVGLNCPPAKSSPLKRSDGFMNLDQASVGSPSAKRRSLHGASFGADFDIFDHEAALQSGTGSQNSEDGSDNMASYEPTSTFSPLPKRSSSLRRTTLQQRHEKPAFARSRLSLDQAHDAVTPGQTATKSKFRQSLGNIIPSKNRESPFSFQGNLPSASAHPISQQSSQLLAQGDQLRPQRHPLSRTITQSSSNSSLAEDSPTHPPVRHPGPRKFLIDFSKSLPVVGQKPLAHGNGSNGQNTQASSNDINLATPENYKLARPHPAAFASTGLISKRHKNVDDVQPNSNGSKSLMPDTPCKRHSLVGAPTTTGAPSVKKDEKDRRVRHSFGTPSTPFSPHTAQLEPGALGKGVSIFGSNVLKASLQRRGSFISAEGDENGQSPVGKGDSQSSTDFELPPTPTKQMLASGSLPQLNIGQSPSGNGSPAHAAAAKTLPNINSSSDQACKSISIGSCLRTVDEDNDTVVHDSPSVPMRFRNSHSVPSSFTRSRCRTGNFKSPTPLNRISYTLPFRSFKSPGAKRSPLSPASPINDLFERLSPHTPRDYVIPPDPSRLSISAHGDGGVRPMEGVTSSASMVPPATPTMMKDTFPQFGLSHSSVTPLKNFQPVDIDQALISRFDKVEIVGTGEFSQVYRCTKATEAKGYLALPNGRASPKTPLQDRVWAVKKSRKAFTGQRDRQRKLQEVEILRSMASSDHVLQFCDSWEEKGHLYIQTEFCEEGTLDLFLVQEGRKGRLDDFRIWKIMSELALVRSSTPKEAIALNLIPGSQACS